jgi:hypothetical protein
MRKVSRSVLALALLTALSARLGAEGGVGSIFPALSSALPEEAPSSIFDAKLSSGPDSDAQLLVSGSWAATILSSIDLQSTKGSALALSTAQPFLFTQSPALSLSFQLYKRYFVEAEVSDDITKAKYSAGYRGGEGEALRELRVGNEDISFPSLPFLSFGSGSYRSFGASALVGDDRFAGKAMLRYDQAERVEKRFVGGTEVSDTSIAASSFVSGKYFLTLYAPSSSGVVVYVQSSSGSIAGSDGNSYRKLDSSEYSYSASTGFIALSAAASTRVLAYYSGSGQGSDAITVAGKACDFLYDPPSSDHSSATIDPKLQVLCRYATTATSSNALAYVKNVAAGAEDSSLDVTIDDSGYLEVSQSGTALSASSSLPERAAYRRPFADSSHGDMDWIYTTDFACTTNTLYEPSYSRSVIVRAFSSSASITIDTDFVAGSVQVSRDGLADYSFSVNDDTGVVTLSPEPSASEEIVVSYMKLSSERKSGILVGALGGFWDLGSGLSAWTALGATWSVPGTSYSSGGSTSPGSLALVAGAKDSSGPLAASLSVAGRYTREDSTGFYRIEGMESSSTYSSTLRPLTDDTATYFSASEIADSDLSSSFSSIEASLHSDGTTQKALKIAAGSGSDSREAEYYKVEDSIEYANYATFSFYAKLPADAVLLLKLDDGAASPAASVSITVPADAAREFVWKRYVLHYGSSDAAVYVQASESAAEAALEGGSSVSPGLSSKGSRLVVELSGMASGEVAWIDEIGLSDAVGDAALLGQGKLSYQDKDFKLGPDGHPVLSDIAASSYANAALASDSYVSGGGSVKATLSVADFQLARIGLNAGVASTSTKTSFSSGHSITLPAQEGFPLQISDLFDYAPASGAFGRSDTLSLAAGKLASLSATQESAWTPASSSLDTGMLLQTWTGKLGLGSSLVSFDFSAKNRAWPSDAPAPASSGSDYGSAWLGAYAYALPACEDSSDLREAKLSLSAKAGNSGEFLAASLGESSTPQSSSSGIRRDSASAKLSLPLSFDGLAIAPYYSRSWKDKRNAKTDGMVADASATLGDIEALPILYASLPFEEFFLDSTLSDFSAQTLSSGAAFPSASYVPETGLALSREFGSYWYDLLLPSAMNLSFGRSLARSSDTVTDDWVWSASAKIASVNLFGSMGAYPLGFSFFDSDEYLTTLQATYTLPRDGGATSLDLLYHGLATLHMGTADTFDLESKAAVDKLPESSSWSASLGFDLSRRIPGHWVLGAFERSLAWARPQAEAAADGQKPSIVSQYLSDIASRDANFRRTFGLSAGLSGYESDSSSYEPGYAFAESYEAKITVPERLTLKLNAAFDQSLVASTQVLTLGFELSLSATISF